MSYPYDDGCQEQEDANWRACHEAASQVGYTVKEVEECDDGNLMCPGCPWRKEEGDAPHPS